MHKIGSTTIYNSMHIQRRISEIQHAHIFGSGINGEHAVLHLLSETPNFEFPRKTGVERGETLSAGG